MVLVILCEVIVIVKFASLFKVATGVVIINIPLFNPEFGVTVNKVLSPLVVTGEPVPRRPPPLLRLDGGDHVDDFVHIRQNLPYPAFRFAV